MEKNYIFGILIVGSFTKLLGEHVQKVSKKLTTWIVRLQRLKWKEKFFSTMHDRDNRL